MKPEGSVCESKKKKIIIRVVRVFLRGKLVKKKKDSKYTIKFTFRTNHGE